jgi:hypothetical protein
MGRYLIKVHRERADKRSPYVIAQEIGVMHPLIYRDAGKVGGVFPRLEPTGRRNRKALEIVVRKGTTAEALRPPAPASAPTPGPRRPA